MPLGCVGIPCTEYVRELPKTQDRKCDWCGLVEEPQYKQPYQAAVVTHLQANSWLMVLVE